jgi:hypothetical protein
MGDALSTLRNPKLVESSNDNPLRAWYEFDPAQPNAAFSKYSAFVTPKHGVCSLSAQNSGNIEGTGSSIDEARFNELVGILKKKYGTPITPPELEKSTAPIMEGIDQPVWKVWDRKRKTADLTLPDEISAIAVAFFAKTGHVAVSYILSNYEDCEKELKITGL